MTDISRRVFSQTVASGILSGTLHGSAMMPNIVLICSDQHSGPVVGANGYAVVRTPNLDRLAARGVNFRNAYCGNPVCAPARASLMTGRFASDVGSYCNSTPFDGRVPAWSNLLRQAGYDCWATGKMDLTEGADFGFQEVETQHQHSRNPDITSLFRAPVCFRPGERALVDGQFKDRRHRDEHHVRLALEFLRQKARQAGRPWVLYLGLHMPHPRWVAAKRFEDRYPPDRMPLPSVPPGYLERRHTAFQILANFKGISAPVPEQRIRNARAAYFAMVSEVDELVGQIVDQVEESAQWDRTLLVYTSDHGEMLGEHGLWFKNVLLEPAARVPLLMAGAGLPIGKTVETPVSHVDLAVTLLGAAGLEKPPGLRGHSLLSIARGEAGGHPGFAFSESHSEGNCTGSFLIRRGKWKYVYFTGDTPLLFDLNQDPSELYNLAGKPETAEVQRELHSSLLSLVDPDAVTRQAFEEQDRRLRGMVTRMSGAQFYETLVGRLGPAQARVLTMKYYRS